MNNEIKLTEINVSKGGENTFNAEITNATEAVIEAHNADTSAHFDTINNIKNRIESLETLRDNMVVKQELPEKLSDLQNDLSFVSEETLVNAIELRQLTNKETVENLVNQAKTEAQEAITVNVNTINTTLSRLEGDINTKTAASRIANLASPSSRAPIALSLPSTQTMLYAPADGLFAVFLAGAQNGSCIWLQRQNGNSMLGGNLSQEWHTGFEIPVYKNEPINFYGDRVKNVDVKFRYLNGSAPA